MTYPLSSPVAAGQPTASAHYNNLLQDALYLGNPAADSDLLGSLLSNYQSGLQLQYLATNRVRVPASPAAPVRLMVAGAIQSAVANVDLPNGSVPTGGAATWYVFAQRAPGSTTFTVNINTSPIEAPLTRLIGQFYWTVSAITKLQTINRQDIFNQTGLELSLVCQGRLTLSAGIPLTTTDVLSASMVYFSPYNGSTVALWDVGTGWRTWYFTEISLVLSSLVANKNYDIFLYNNSGTLTLEALAWTSDSARATVLALQDGVYVKSGDPTRRYLGTIRTTSVAGQCEDSKRRRFVWNFYNQLLRPLFVFENTSHTYNVEAARPWNNSLAATQLEAVVGVAGAMVYGFSSAFKSNSNGAGYYCFHSIYQDGTDSNSVGHYEYGNSNFVSFTAHLQPNYPAPGYHYFYTSEISYGTSSYYYCYTNVFLPG